MENDGILIHWDRQSYEWTTIRSEHVKSIDTLREYFDRDLDELLDDSGELIIYKLVPFARISKNVEYKIETDE